MRSIRLRTPTYSAKIDEAEGGDMATTVIMPQLGEAVIEGTIAAWLKEPGDSVAQYEPLLEIETDKVTTEATAEVAGTLLKILVPAGETVEVGTVLAVIGKPGEDIDQDLEFIEVAGNLDPALEREIASPSAVSPAASEPVPPPSNGPGQGRSGVYKGRISPVVGRIAEEHNIDLNLVQGTGREGRITKRDILDYIDLRNKGLAVGVLPVSTTETGLAQEPPKGPAPTPGEILPLTSIRRAIAEHMVRSKHTSPHVTTIFEIDFSRVAAHRKANKESFVRDGANLTFTTYVVAALVQAIRTHPLVNSSWHEKGIEIKREINIGMATAINDGLIVPVIKNADKLSLLAIARAVNDLSHRARVNKLLPDDVQGGTFTLTNHGVSGSLIATPIINQPQCAILGMGKIEKRVKVINDAIAIRLMAYASLTFDHRILDGAIADGFMSTFAQLIEEWN